MAVRAVLDQVNVVTRDMRASVAFYRRLGAEIPDRDPGWDAHHRSAASETAAPSLDLDSAVFARHWCRGWQAGRAGAVIGFRVDSRAAVDAIYADLTGAGHRGLQPPYDAFWGARYAVVEDPDGNAVGIMSPLDPARRGPPPDPAALG